MLLKLPGDLDKTKRAALDTLDDHYSRFIQAHLHSALVAIVKGEVPTGLLEREARRAALAAEIESATSANQIRQVMARARITFGAMNHGANT